MRTSTAASNSSNNLASERLDWRLRTGGVAFVVMGVSEGMRIRVSLQKDRRPYLHRTCTRLPLSPYPLSVLLTRKTRSRPHGQGFECGGGNRKGGVEDSLRASMRAIEG